MCESSFNTAAVSKAPGLVSPFSQEYLSVWVATGVIQVSSLSFLTVHRITDSRSLLVEN